MGKYRIFLFAKDAITGIALFLNQLSRLNNNYFSLDFYFYKRSKYSQHPRGSHFINSAYPDYYGPSPEKIYLLLINIFRTIEVLKRIKPNLVIACNLYSFIVLSISLTFFKNPLKFLYLIEINLIKSIEARPFWLYRYLLVTIVKLLLIKVDWLLFSSKNLAQDTVDKFKIRNKRITVIPYGIDIIEARKMSKEKIPFKDTVILNSHIPNIFSIGRFEDQKDFKTVLKGFAMAIQKGVNANLCLIGDGSLKVELMETAKTLGIEKRVFFLGWKKNVFPYLKHADIFVLSSFYEGFGIVILEAMAVGVPIISTNSPYGPSEILDNGNYGILVPVGDAEGLSSAMMELLTDKKKYRHYAKRASERSRFFSVEKMLKEYERLIREA